MTRSYVPLRSQKALLALANRSSLDVARRVYDINYSLDACDGLLLGKDRRACSSHIGVLQRAAIPDSVEELCGECFLVHRCPPGLMLRASSCSRGTFGLM